MQTHTTLPIAEVHSPRHAATTCILMMGGTGSGKSTVRMRDYDDMTVVDSDVIKARHPAFDPKHPGLVHEFSSQEATREFYGALSRREAVVFDGTGSTADKYVQFAHAAHSAGYRVTVVYVTCDVAVALDRNRTRARTVDESVLRASHARAGTSFEIVSRYADEVRIVHN